jgi:hypothetical protein
MDWGDDSNKYLTTFLSGDPSGYRPIGEKYSSDSIGSEEPEELSWRLWFGEIVKNNQNVDVSKGNFGVTSKGILYANDAVIKGDITAERGLIGNWLLDSNDLYSKTGNSIAFFSAKGRDDSETQETNNDKLKY